MRFPSCYFKRAFGFHVATYFHYKTEINITAVRNHPPAAQVEWGTDPSTPDVPCAAASCWLPGFTCLLSGASFLREASPGCRDTDVQAAPGHVPSQLPTWVLPPEVPTTVPSGLRLWCASSLTVSAALESGGLPLRMSPQSDLPLARPCPHSAGPVLT